MVGVRLVDWLVGWLIELSWCGLVWVGKRSKRTKLNSRGLTLWIVYHKNRFLSSGVGRWGIGGIVDGLWISQEMDSKVGKMLGKRLGKGVVKEDCDRDCERW